MEIYITINKKIKQEVKIYKMSCFNCDFTGIAAINLKKAIPGIFKNNQMLQNI